MTAQATPRSALALLGFAMTVFVVSFPLMVIALRDVGPATATLARMLGGAAVLAIAARGSFGRLRGHVRASRSSVRSASASSRGCSPTR